MLAAIHTQVQRNDGHICLISGNQYFGREQANIVIQIIGGTLSSEVSRKSHNRAAWCDVRGKARARDACNREYASVVNVLGRKHNQSSVSSRA